MITSSHSLLYWTFIFTSFTCFSWLNFNCFLLRIKTKQQSHTKCLSGKSKPSQPSLSFIFIAIILAEGHFKDRWSGDIPSFSCWWKQQNNNELILTGIVCASTELHCCPNTIKTLQWNTHFHWVICSFSIVNTDPVVYFKWSLIQRLWHNNKN